MMLRIILDDEVLETESVDREEDEFMSIIEEYREEGNFKGVCAQRNNLVEYLIIQERFDTALEEVEENISQLITLDRKDENVKLYLFIARILKAEILMSNDNPEDVRKEIDIAFEVVPDVIAKWKLGLGTGKEYYERGMKLRRTVNTQT